MLVLTRRRGESIRIGTEIKIAFLGYEGGQAKIGIDAPKKVEVHREEIYQKILLQDDNFGNK